MIIQIRGTHGSGKSHLVSQIMTHYECAPLYAGRSIPAGYECFRNDSPRLWIPGSYRNACGGCDTIKTLDEAYESVALNAEHGDVLFEGILAQHSFPKIAALKHLKPTIILLSTPLVECVAAVRARREARGDDRPFDPTNVEREWKGARSGFRRLRDAGFDAQELSREEAFSTVLSLLGVTR